MIKHIITDVDGTLTPGQRQYLIDQWIIDKDGSIKWNPHTSKIFTIKQFHCRDTEAAFLFRDKGVKVSILTSSRSNIQHVREWAKEARIGNVMYVKGESRVDVFKQLNKAAWPSLRFIGDSYIDQGIFNLGIKGFCPRDAASCLLEHDNVQPLSHDGGKGILMEAFLWLEKRSLI